MKRGADWFAWILQFIVGLVVGALFGFALLHFKFGRPSSRPLFQLAPEQVSTFILGAALIVAGLASLRGDRLWMGSSYNEMLSDDYKHSRASRFISIVTMVLGGILVLTALFEH